MTDIAIFFSETTGFDIGLDGLDLATESGLRSAVIISLFTDARAKPDDVLPDGSHDRRGCWMDSFMPQGQSIGSRLWLLSREKELPDVPGRAKEYAEEALEWLIKEGAATAVSVTAERAARSVLLLKVRITLPSGSVFEDVFNYTLEAA